MRLFVVLVLVGCSTTRNPERCLDGLCADPKLPFCDSTGAIGGEPNTCVAVDCSPNAFEECRGDRALTCNAAGDNYDLVQCEYGCGSSGCMSCDTPDCEKRIVPRYVPTACGELATKQMLDVTQNTFLDTGSDACTAVVTQPTGPDICLMKYQVISIQANQTLKVRGTRALALVADYALTVAGTLDVSADGSTNGPGVTLISGSASSTNGGGGAGYRTAGAAGGTATMVGGAANGGLAGSSPLVVSELFGGRFAKQEANTQVSGGGGGAVTLVSCRDILSLSGLIDAGGGGGASGLDYVNGGFSYRPPTGGGSGGTIVLQGLKVAVTGQLFANGGGGGGGGSTVFIADGDSPSMPGQDAQRSLSPAIGGSGYSGNAGSGGRGGDGATIAGPAPGGPPNSPGAGGGSSGYIVIYSPEANVPTVAPTAVSPTIEPRQIVPTN